MRSGGIDRAEFRRVCEDVLGEEAADSLAFHRLDPNHTGSLIIYILAYYIINFTFHVHKLASQ